MGDDLMIVTGAAGPLGQHIAPHLLREGYALSGFDLADPEDPDVGGSQVIRPIQALSDAVAGHGVVGHIGDVYVRE